MASAKIVEAPITVRLEMNKEQIDALYLFASNVREGGIHNAFIHAGGDSSATASIAKTLHGFFKEVAPGLRLDKGRLPQGVDSRA